MKNISIVSFVIMVLLQTSNVSATENPKEKNSKSAVNVNSEIKDLLDAHDFGDINTSEGNVYVKYYVDQNNIIHINQISSPNEKLKKYVFKTLEGKEVSTQNAEINKEALLKLNFNLTSN